MKTVCKKLLCLMLVAMMLVSAVPFAFAAETTNFWIQLWVVEGENKECVKNEMHSDFAADKVEDKAYIESFAKSKYPEYFDGSVSVTVEQDNTIGAAVYVEAKAEEPKEDPKPEDNNRPGQDNNRPGQDNNRPGQDNNRPGQTVPGFKPEDNKDDNKPGNTPNIPGQNNKPGHNYDKNHFPGNGHGKPNFNWETVELTVVYNFPDNHRFMGRTSETFTVWKGSDILDALAAAESMGYYEVPTRDGYTMAGYSFDKECNNDVNRDDAINEDMTIYCEWEKSYITLRVYTNGDTRYPDKTFDLSAYAKDGKITQAEVENLLDSKYSAKSGYTLAYYGLFTDKTWDNGKYDNDDAVSNVKVNAFGKTTIYVMVKNVKKAVADSSNPKTGDNIMIAVGTMALSAAALVSIIELKKRKMI